MRLSPNSVNGALLAALAAMLAACGDATQPSVAPPLGPSKTLATGRSVSPSASVTETVLYSFGSHQPDGIYPTAGLTRVKGELYGVTSESTASREGSIYSVTTSGVETVLHKLTKKQGTQDLRDLTSVGRDLYGTAFQGGAYDYGSVFKVAPTGRVIVLHSFPEVGGTDGAFPWTSLLSVNGTLYGTTFAGGTSDAGTVFSITGSGAESVLYSFAGENSGDGSLPEAGLVKLGGKLYGTTSAGGTSDRGTVFSVSTAGTERVLHSFQGTPDGADPIADLIAIDGTLYGTTLTGGTGCPTLGGCGTVFSISPSGTYTVLYRFTGTPDGENPATSLLNFDGTMYGTTYAGGASGFGTVFSITPSGSETVLYNFAGGQDGAKPDGDLIEVKGTLYGTTEMGGGSGYGYGTVFSLTPANRTSNHDCLSNYGKWEPRAQNCYSWDKHFH